eukprot:scaffold447_cov307-Pinguiococcus_pyrenoidosus.AAC.30
MPRTLNKRWSSDASQYPQTLRAQKKERRLLELADGAHRHVVQQNLHRLQVHGWLSLREPDTPMSTLEEQLDEVLRRVLECITCRGSALRGASIRRGAMRDGR